MEAVTIKAVFVGHIPTGQVLWHTNTGKFRESKHVRFSEKEMYRDGYKNQLLEFREFSQQTNTESEMDESVDPRTNESVL